MFKITAILTLIASIFVMAIGLHPVWSISLMVVAGSAILAQLFKEEEQYR